jgi:hypothetical protein
MKKTKESTGTQSIALRRLFVGKKILAVFAGTVIMIIMNILLLYIPQIDENIAMSAAVIAGATLAGFIAGTHGWVFGLLVGAVNCFVALTFFYWISPLMRFGQGGYSAAIMLARPFVLSLISGVVGGFIGNWLNTKFMKNRFH